MFELIFRKQALSSGSALTTQELDEHYPRQRRTYKLFDMADCLMTALSRRCNLEKAFGGYA